VKVDDEAAAFVSRTVVMLGGLCLSERDLELVTASMRYAYAQGYRDADMAWTLGAILQKRRP